VRSKNATISRFVVLRGIEKHGNRDRRQRTVGEGSRVGRHEHNGPYTRVAEFGDVVDVARSLPSGSATEGAELGVVGMLAAMRDDRGRTGWGTGDGQRGVAAIRMTHDADAVAFDVRPESCVLEDRVDDAGHLLRPADPYADAGYVVASASRVRGRRDASARSPSSAWLFCQASVSDRCVATCLGTLLNTSEMARLAESARTRGQYAANMS
jgi:hypothetical protein